MVSNIVMKVLLIEDDENECAIYKNIIETKNNIKLVAITNSSNEAIKYVNDYKPDGIILDLELNNGEGSGFEFIEKLKKQNINKIPKIVVTTNIYSDSVYNFLHKNKIDFIFYKNQASYSNENVLNTLLLLNEYEVPNKVVVNMFNENEGENDKLSDLINKELDLIGVSTHLKGRKYLHDAIYFVTKNDESSEKISVIQYLVAKYKRSNSTISRAMQNAILHAWRISSLEDLSALYTARINYETGVPTPTEFIYYYSDKIKKIL
ncbi:MAG: response regulator [Clostridia bacterium]|nr:response regulator [Clostridia bacterium]